MQVSQPPRAAIREHVQKIHQTEVSDPWYWLREQDNPAVVAHLQQENAYTDEVLAKSNSMRELFFHELKARIMEDDASVPVKDGAYWYYSRVEKNAQYPLHYRRRSPEGEGELLLDGNRLARGKSYFDLGFCEASPDHRYLVYGVDVKGDETYTLRVKDLETGKLLTDKIVGAYACLEWMNDSQSFYYVRLDENFRPFQVYWHKLGQPSTADRLVYEEADRRFYVGLEKSEDRRFIFVASEGNNMAEWYYLPAEGKGDATPCLIEERRPEHEYDVSSHGEFFYIRTNSQAMDYKLVRTPITQPAAAHWQDVLAHESGRLLEGFCLFADYLVTQEKRAARPRIVMTHLVEGTSRALDFDGEPCEVSVMPGREFHTTKLRYSYTSLRKPYRIYELDMATGDEVLVKRQEVPDPSFDEERYETAMVWAPTADGRQVPVSLLYRRDTPRDGSAPLYLYGYGAYGLSMEPGFSITHLSLVDRGFVFAIAHVRGGMELGRGWYEDGKLLNKAHSFGDFIAVAEFLIREGFSAAGRIVACGGSAGGMLVGAAANQRPELFKAVIAHVPFVDVLNTMLDDSLPLTAAEYNEWGNPHEPVYFECIKTYSPYDNVRPQAYPAMFVTAGFSDPRVTYWEPAKWVQKLRSANTGNSPILLRVHFEAGHLGASGRYDHLKEVAEDLAFVAMVYDLPFDGKQ